MAKKTEPGRVREQVGLLGPETLSILSAFLRWIDPGSRWITVIKVKLDLGRAERAKKKHGAVIQNQTEINMRLGEELFQSRFVRKLRFAGSALYPRHFIQRKFEPKRPKWEIEFSLQLFQEILR